MHLLLLPGLLYIMLHIILLYLNHLDILELLVNLYNLLLSFHTIMHLSHLLIKVTLQIVKECIVFSFFYLLTSIFYYYSIFTYFCQK